MNTLFRSVLLGSLALVAAAPAWAASLKGQVRAVRVTGDVSVTVGVSNVSIPVTEGMVLRERTTVSTGAASRVVLLFSTGSSVSLRPRSQLAIDGFSQDPFQGDLRNRIEEASPSKTSLRLVAGSLVSSVRKLSDKSEYYIRTPLGTAGIRGTRVEVTFEPAAVRATTTTESGLVVWQGNFADVEPLNVGRGLSAVASGELDAANNVTEYRVELVQVDEARLEGIAGEADIAEAMFMTNPPPPPVDPGVVADPIVDALPGAPAPAVTPVVNPIFLSPSE